MITFIAHLRVKPENASAYEELMAYVASMTHKHEPGVRYYEFAKSVDQRDTYVVVEVYQDAQAHATHMDSDWVKESLPKSLRLIEGKPDIKQYVAPGSLPVKRRT
jgi:quinol monooxygenase YgiN